MIEEWKDIKDFEGIYQVSNFGRVRSFHRCIVGRILKPLKHHEGYLFVILKKDCIYKHFKIHRLVAEAFIPNTLNLPQVNHKDEDKTNNHVDNLEWCDNKYNVNYGTRTKRASEKKINGKLSKPILQYNLDGTFVKEWLSASDCGRNGFNPSAIIRCCKDKLNKHHGYIWKYK